MYHRPKSCDWGVTSVGRSGISVSLLMKDVCDVSLPVYIVTSREILAEVSAAALFASERRARDQQTDGDEARHSSKLAIGRRAISRTHDRGPPRGQLSDSGSQAGLRANQSRLLPHEIADIRRGRRRHL